MRPTTPVFPSLVLLLLAAACGNRADVVLYCATDQETSERFVKLFEERSGIRVKARYDTEANKTVGLVNNLVEEAPNPRCDVFWNNELVHTVRLVQAGILEPYVSPAAAAIPAAFKDPGGHYAGFAARARILIVNTDLMPDEAQRPKSMWDLLDPKYKGKCTMARPLTGTTLTHVAALYATIGEAETRRFLDGLVANEVHMAKGNGHVMRMVSAGEVAFGFTDTDDFHIAWKEKGFPVAAVYPDQDGIGTFVIPNTVGRVKGGPNPEAAKKLIDFLLSEEIEGMLAASRSAQIPVRASVQRPAWVKSTADFKVATWDPAKTAAAMERHLPELRERFGQ